MLANVGMLFSSLKKNLSPCPALFSIVCGGDLLHGYNVDNLVVPVFD